jgi:PAS domain S-box-containing protein
MTSALTHPTILIIDDSPEDRATYRRYLSRVSHPVYQIVEAEEGSSILALCHQYQPDVVLLDYCLPGLDGLRMLEQLKQYQETLPVIMLTGQGNETVAVQAIKKGAEDYLVKGQTSADKLRLVVQNAIDNARLRQQLQHSEDHRQENQRFIEQITNTTPGLIYVYDLIEQRNVFINQQVMALLGYSPAQIQAMGGELFTRLFHPDDLARVPAHLERFQQTQAGEVLHMEYRMQHTNGEWRWFSDRGVVFRRTEEGRLWQILGVAQDITDFKQIQERYELAAVAVNCLIYDWDVHSQSVTRSQGILPLLGCTPEEAGTDLNWWSDRIHPDDLPRVTAACAASLAEQDRFAVEYRIRHRDGHYIWVLDHAVALRDAAGTIVRVVGSTRDISDRKISEENLRQSLQEIYDLYNQAPCGYHSLDLDGVITLVNDTELQMLGYTRAEMLGKQMLGLLNPESQQIFQDHFPSFQQQNHSQELELQMVCKDGSILPVSARSTAIQDAAGNLLTHRMTLIDIRQRKQAESLLREREERLNFALDAARTARAEAETANQAKDDFIAVVSHELRSPLNSMLGWTKLIKMGKIDEETLPQALQAIERGAQAQVQLVDDLLDISRIIRGKLNLIFTPFNVASMLEIAINLAGPTTEARQIRLEQQINTSATLLVSGDSQRIQQVVGNLLTNAIKFTPPGGQITVGLEQIELGQQGQGADESMQRVSPYPHSNLPAPSYAKITVTDTGKGISAELLPHIFDRFRQDKRIAGKTKDGLGLGLAIVQQLVEMHQGKVFVDSPGEGLGATFTILLPLIHQSMEGDATLPLSPQPLLDCTGIRILVVDDEPDIVNYLKFILETQGAIVAAETTARKGFEQILSFKPDLIMSDIGMPEEDGYAFLQRIRGLADNDGGQTPAIALTAFAQPDTREKVLAAGFQLYLKKPIEPEHLVEAIVNLLRKPS